MVINPNGPLIIQSDRTILLEVNNPEFTKARERLAKFAELVKSPEYMHTYQITPLSLWNAAASGITAGEIIADLNFFSKFEVQYNIKMDISEYVNRYGLLSLVREDENLILKSEESRVIDEIISYSSLKDFFKEQVNQNELVIDENFRGLLKQELIKLGYPVKDLAGYQEGEFLPISLLEQTRAGKEFKLRDYQLDGISAFYSGGTVHGGSGVIVLPCGSGKTIIGIGVIAEIKNETLILTTNTTSVRQWINEILDKTSISPEQIGEYSGNKKEVRPITVATYQILTHRTDREGEFTHMKLFQERNWGLIIYDEVHLLPAPVFRFTANIQAKKRLGLTATLIREDKKEEEVFTLIGAKKYDVPWVQMEDQGWIAEARCTEIRIPLTYNISEEYFLAAKRNKYKIAATNPSKISVLKKILEEHQNNSILIIGQYLEQLKRIADELKAPLITGRVKQDERDEIYHKFKKGKIKILVVSKVANFALDLPDAKVAVQVSGTFGSRQEEAQRLGRILRPKGTDNQAYFYTLVSQNTIDQDYAMKRQLFLVEQGYQYEIREQVVKD